MHRLCQPQSGLWSLLIGLLVLGLVGNTPAVFGWACGTGTSCCCGPSEGAAADLPALKAVGCMACCESGRHPSCHIDARPANLACRHFTLPPGNSAHQPIPAISATWEGVSPEADHRIVGSDPPMKRGNLGPPIYLVNLALLF